MKEVRIGIIGTGFARRVQIPGFLACDGTRIVSVASGTLKNAGDTARESGAEHFTGDWRETVDHPDVDLVCVTTPPDTHRDIVVRALGNRKNVLAEKPMAMSAAEAEEMAAKARESGVLAIIDHELRFLHGRRKALEILRSGEIGRIRHAKANFRAPHRGDPEAPWNWWSDRNAGGGALGAIGSHSIDSLLWSLGAGIESVFCRLQTHIRLRRDSAGTMRKVTTDDEANLIVKFGESEFTEDAAGTIAVSMTEYPKYQNRMEFFGTKGAIRVESLGELFIGRAGDADWTEIPVDLGTPIPGIPDTGFSRGFMNLAPLVVEAVREGRTTLDNAATFEDGLKVQRVLDAARMSDETGAEVKL